LLPVCNISHFCRTSTSPLHFHLCASRQQGKQQWAFYFGLSFGFPYDLSHDYSQTDISPQAEQEQLKIQIREALAERSTNYLEVGCHKVRLSDFSSTRLDSKAIKAVAPDLYDQYSKTVTGTRLSIT
jgi:hypothetical protein